MTYRVISEPALAEFRAYARDAFGTGNFSKFHKPARSGTVTGAFDAATVHPAIARIIEKNGLDSIL
jgi:hypothetical protein